MALTCRFSSSTERTEESSDFKCVARAQEDGGMLRGSGTPSMDEVVISFMEHRRMRCRVEREMLKRRGGVEVVNGSVSPDPSFSVIAIEVFEATASTAQ
jgi:hypothetical protein